MSRARLDVVLSPLEALPDCEAWLVIDVLRATTTLTTFLERGGHCVLPVAELEEARAWRARLGPAWLTLGERGGLRVPDFDLGNSPLALSSAQAAQATGLIMSTSHGTAAIVKAEASGRPVFAACARNATAVLKAALARTSSLGVLCAGRARRAALDDTLVAGLLVRSFLKEAPAGELTDGARLALAALLAGPASFAAALACSAHAAFMRELGLDDDLRFCAAIDESSVVPELLPQKMLPGAPSCFVLT